MSSSTFAYTLQGVKRQGDHLVPLKTADDLRRDISKAAIPARAHKRRPQLL